MKTLAIAGAAAVLALATLSAPLALAQGTSPGSDAGSNGTTTAPGATGVQPATPGTIPPAGPGTAVNTTPDVATPPAAMAAKKPGGPEKGANSFTEGQAQARISDAGYTSVTGLKKDADGIWHGTAMKNGQQVGVWLDYAGNVGQS